MTRRYLWPGVLVAGVLAAAIFACQPLLVGSAGSNNRATTPGKSHGRSVSQIMQDVRETRDDLNQVITSPQVLLDATRRQQAAPRATRVLKQMVGYLQELADTGNAQGVELASQLRPHYVMLLALFGDTASESELAHVAADGKGGEALSAKLELLTLRWIRADNDPSAQEAIAGQAAALARENPREDRVTEKLIELSDIHPANGSIADRLQTAAADMNTRTAQGFREELEGRRKLRALENKPLTITGPLNGGGTFSTAGWKGKVILVDFWATWCVPCRKSLPDVKKVYAEYHDKGFEIVGVSCDNSAEELNSFLKQNPDMPWPQLFDARNPGWNAIATGFGVTGIPTMFLIDRAGVVRSVDARESFQTLIPRLLAQQQP